MVSSSNNAQEVLEAAGIDGLFDARVDGRVAEREHLKGKPAPDTFLAGARAVGVKPANAAVFEDAQAGVAGRARGQLRLGDRSQSHRTGTGAARPRRRHRGRRSRGTVRARVIAADHFTVNPWTVPERQLNLEVLAQTESIFALSNGHIGMRGNLDEGEPSGVPGTYLNAFFETRPLPYAESGYGYPEAGQTMINVTNGKLIRLLVDDEPFDVRYGKLLDHERVLDMREGVLRRSVHWSSPAGQEVRISTIRLVSFIHRAIAAICYEVETVGEDARIVVQSELVTNEPLPVHMNDPRAAAALRAPLDAEFNSHHDLRALLAHRTRASRLRMACAMDHIIDGPDGTVATGESDPDLARVTISTELAPGQKLRVIKFLAYGWSSRRSLPSLRDQVDGALASARRTGWDGLLKGQREFLDEIWSSGDIELEGDAALQQAVRFALFHVVQAAARAERRAIPAKGQTGNGYDGHTFWDTEAYTVPVLSYVHPPAARDVLTWRHTTMDQAQERARVLGLDGVAFPWRTIRGHECSGYWPAGTAAFHINADIANAVRQYLAASGDEQFEKGYGMELVVATARLWRSLGHHDVNGGFRIDGVTGPDEYTALVDNNVYTNLMAARNLTFAAELANRHPQIAQGLGVNAEEVAGWRDAAGAVVIPSDPELGVTQQSEGFTRQRRWDFDTTSARPVSVAAALPQLSALQQSGRQAGRPRLRAVHVRRILQRRTEGARLRLLRAHYGPRFVLVGRRPGDRRFRGRVSRAGLRLPQRDSVRRPARSQRQHPRWCPHGLAGRILARDRGRIRRPARLRPQAVVCSSAANAIDTVALRTVLPRTTPEDRGQPGGGALRAGTGRSDRADPPREVVQAPQGLAEDPPDPGHQPRRASSAAAWTRPAPAPRRGVSSPGLRAINSRVWPNRAARERVPSASSGCSASAAGRPAAGARCR